MLARDTGVLSESLQKAIAATVQLFYPNVDRGSIIAAIGAGNISQLREMLAKQTFGSGGFVSTPNEATAGAVIPAPQAGNVRIGIFRANPPGPWIDLMRQESVAAASADTKTQKTKATGNEIVFILPVASSPVTTGAIATGSQQKVEDLPLTMAQRIVADLLGLNELSQSQVTTLARAGFRGQNPIAGPLGVKIQIWTRDKNETGNWHNRIRSVLRPIIERSFTKQDIIKELLSDENMPIWEQAFTHETWDPNNNYERLEYLGDVFLKYAFPQFLRTTERFKNLKQSEYTNLNTYYMSNVRQAELSRSLGLSNLIRIQANLSEQMRSNLHIDADVFESFFGAVNQILDKYTMGGGYRAGQFIFNAIIPEQELSFERKYGDPKTQTNQMFTRFRYPSLTLPEPRVEEKIGDSTVTYSIILQPELINFLASTLKVKIRDPLIGQATASTKTGAETAAYFNALETLEKQYNITTAAMMVLKNGIFDFQLDPRIAEANEILNPLARKAGFKYYFFFTPPKLKKPQSSVNQLRGEREDGQKEILSSKIVLKGSDTTESRLQLIQEAILNLQKSHK